MCSGMMLGGLVINPRKLAAIDLALLGSKFVIAEFAAAVLFCPALGAWVLVRGHTYLQIALGLYLISLGINYFPMLLYAVTIARHSNAWAEMGVELDNKKEAMAKYRLQSLSLLVPLLVPAVSLMQGRRA